MPPLRGQITLAEDPTLLGAFLDESRESLDGLDARLSGLDRSVDLKSEVEAIFRPVHTLKGNAAFFGFMEVQRLAHAMETILDLLRKGRLALTQEATDALLAGCDVLRSCIERVRAGESEVDDVSAFSSLIARLAKLGVQTPLADPWQRIFADLLDLESKEDRLGPDVIALLARLRHDLASVRPVPAAAIVDGMPLRQRLIKPLDTPLDQAAAKSVIDELTALRPQCMDQEQRRLLDDLLSTCSVFVGSVGFDEVLRKHVIERLDQIFPSPVPAARPGNAGNPGSDRRSRSETDGIAKSMRVSEEAVDGFLAHVGELLVIGDQLDHLQRRMSSGTADQHLTRDMRQAVASFSILSDELQRSIMAVRRVQVRSMLQKAPRLVRDIAQAKGKEIAVEITGETTEIDKGRLELLDGPLTHLVRNCADHGIEPPAERVAAGKPACGRIELRASAVDGWFCLEIADDGKGLDLTGIRRKAEELGIVKPGAELAEQDIIDLIFASGLSTAASVSDVSGRGVGMDVVKRQISEAGGAVTVTTARGKGTTFSLRLPSSVSTQIIPGFLVRDGDGLFALPLEVVRESFVDDQARLADGSGVVMRHGRLLPVVPLGKAVGQRLDRPGHPCRRTFVTLERHGSTAAISVEETLGVHRLVLRQLHGCSGTDLDGRFMEHPCWAMVAWR